jgi:hypothetical protein
MAANKRAMLSATIKLPVKLSCRRVVTKPQGKPIVRFEWTAQCGDLEVIRGTRVDALAALQADVLFVTEYGTTEAGACRLEAIGCRAWRFTMRTGEPYVFAASSRLHALARLEVAFQDHPDAQTFLGSFAGTCERVDILEWFQPSDLEASI